MGCARAPHAQKYQYFSVFGFHQYPTICASTHMRTIQCHINTNDIKLYQVWMAQKLEVVTVLTNIIIHIIYNNIG